MNDLAGLNIDLDLVACASLATVGMLEEGLDMREGGNYGKIFSIRLSQPKRESFSQAGRYYATFLISKLNHQSKKSPMNTLACFYFFSLEGCRNKVFRWHYRLQ